MVGVTGFEPMASWTRTKRDTKLRHTPRAHLLYPYSCALSRGIVQFSLDIPKKGIKCRENA